MMRFARLKSPAQEVAWNRDGTQLLVCCRDGHLRIIDPDSLEIKADRKLINGWAYVLSTTKRSVIVGGERGQLERTNRRP